MDDNLFKNHNIIVEDRNKFVLTGIIEVISFDEDNVLLKTALGKLVIRGSGIHIQSFEAQAGDLTGEGRIHALIYTAQESEGGFLTRLFR